MAHKVSRQFTPLSYRMTSGPDDADEDANAGHMDSEKDVLAKKKTSTRGTTPINISRQQDRERRGGPEPVLIQPVHGPAERAVPSLDMAAVGRRAPEREFTRETTGEDVLLHGPWDDEGCAGGSLSSRARPAVATSVSSASFATVWRGLEREGRPSAPALLRGPGSPTAAQPLGQLLPGPVATMATLRPLSPRRSTVARSPRPQHPRGQPPGPASGRFSPTQRQRPEASAPALARAPSVRQASPARPVQREHSGAGARPAAGAAPVTQGFGFTTPRTPRQTPRQLSRDERPQLQWPHTAAAAATAIGPSGLVPQSPRSPSMSSAHRLQSAPEAVSLIATPPQQQQQQPLPTSSACEPVPSAAAAESKSGSRQRSLHEIVSTLPTPQALQAQADERRGMGAGVDGAQARSLSRQPSIADAWLPQALVAPCTTASAASALRTPRATLGSGGGGATAAPGGAVDVPSPERIVAAAVAAPQCPGRMPSPARRQAAPPLLQGGLFQQGSLSLPQAPGPTTSLPACFQGWSGAGSDVSLVPPSGMPHLPVHSDRRSLGHLSASQALVGSLIGPLPPPPGAPWGAGRGPPVPTVQPPSARGAPLGAAPTQQPPPTPRLTSAPLRPNSSCASPPCPTPRMTSCSAAATVVAVATAGQAAGAAAGAAAAAGQASAASPRKSDAAAKPDGHGEWKLGNAQGPSSRAVSAGADRRRRFLV